MSHDASFTLLVSCQLSGAVGPGSRPKGGLERGYFEFKCAAVRPQRPLRQHCDLGQMFSLLLLTYTPVRGAVPFPTSVSVGQGALSYA